MSKGKKLRSVDVRLKHMHSVVPCCLESEQQIYSKGAMAPWSWLVPVCDSQLGTFLPNSAFSDVMLRA